MAFKIAVVDLDGCIIDDISRQLDSKLGTRGGPLNGAFREAVFVLMHLVPHSSEFYASLLREDALDANVINAMKSMQEKGTELHVVTKHKGLDKAWLSRMLARHGINISTDNIHVVNGDKAYTIDKLRADLVIDDQPDSVLSVGKGPMGERKILLLKRTYNTVGVTMLKLLRGGGVRITDSQNLAGELEQ
ncbi:MAG: hypothetical protein ACP5UH_03870 [Candidatus Micrarchaeia archaeon]